MLYIYIIQIAIFIFLLYSFFYGMVNIIIVEEYSPGYDELDDYKKTIIDENALIMKLSSEEFFVILEPLLYKSSLSFESVIRNYMKSCGKEPARTLSDISAEQKLNIEIDVNHKDKIVQELSLCVLSMKKNNADTLLQISQAVTKPLERFQLKKQCMIQNDEYFDEITKLYDRLCVESIEYKDYSGALLNLKEMLESGSLEEIIDSIDNFHNTVCGSSALSDSLK